MANDSNELKNNAPCEEKQAARELTHEELAQVSGGNGKFAYKVPFYKPELEWIPITDLMT